MKNQRQVAKVITFDRDKSALKVELVYLIVSDCIPIFTLRRVGNTVSGKPDQFFVHWKETKAIESKDIIWRGMDVTI